MPANPLFNNGRLLFFLVLFPFILLSGCTQLTTTHKTYRYHSFSSVISTARPGGHFTLSWEAMQDADSTAPSPTQETIQAQLFGPFSSLNALKQALKQDGPSSDGPPVAASIPPIHTDTWTNKLYTATFHLPPKLVPGYYELVQKVSTNENGNNIISTAHSELQILA